MMATYTPNYQLHQWEPEDNFMRTDFNTDFSKIDTAIKKVKTDGDSALNAVKQTLNISINAVQSNLDAAKSALEATDAKKCEVYVGTYTGDGADSRSIKLGFTPVAVIVEDYMGLRGGTPYGGLALQGASVSATDGGVAISVTASGFNVYTGNGACTNLRERAYRYIAFR